jgi:hypothetical protein
MAFIKDSPDPTGAVASYWIISEVTINKIGQSVRISLAGFQNRERRLNFDDPSKAVIETKDYVSTTEDFKTIYKRAILGNENPYKLAYRYVKGVEKGDDTIPNPVYWSNNRGELSFFSDAQNEFEDFTPPSISKVSLGNDGSQNIIFYFESNEPLGDSDDAIDVTINGPTTTRLYKFDRSDFNETGNGPYTYTLRGDFPYDGGAGTYAAIINRALDNVGNDGGEGQTDTYTLS